MEEVDIVIVGGGSAGCVLAERLSADGRWRVALLEAGGDDRRFWIKTPIGYGVLFHNSRVNWRFVSAPDPTRGGREDYWPRGKVLGGSSSINAMVYCRGWPEDFDDWRDAGNPGWGWDEMRTAFDGVERRVGADGVATGEGALCVADRRAEHHPIKRFFVAAAREIGLPETDDMNGPAGEGVGAYALTTRGGWRHSAADAFLRPAMRRKNLRVLTGALATRILFEGRRAVGVRYRRGGAERTLRARASVVLAAGAVGDPQLLQLSGVGPGALLSEHGLEAVHVNEGVGGAMQDHLGIDYLYRATEPTLNQVFGGVLGRMAAGARYLASGRGPLSLSVNQMGGMVRTGPEKARPDVQLYFNPLSYSTTMVGRRVLMQPDPWPGFAIGFNPCRPSSRGRISIRSADPTVAPKIAPNGLSSNQDVADVIACARLVGRLMATEAMRPLIAERPAFDPSEADDEALVDDFRRRCGTVYHPCGTCRMAPEGAGGVVDPQLRVYGVEGLRVADASVFPNVTSANTNGPTIALAWRAGEVIAADLRARA